MRGFFLLRFALFSPFSFFGGTADTRPGVCIPWSLGFTEATPASLTPSVLGWVSASFSNESYQRSRPRRAWSPSVFKRLAARITFSDPVGFTFTFATLRTA